MRNKYKYINCHAIETIEPYVHVTIEENKTEEAWNSINFGIQFRKNMKTTRIRIPFTTYKLIPWKELRDTLKFLNYPIETENHKKFTWFNYRLSDDLYIVLK